MSGTGGDIVITVSGDTNPLTDAVTRAERVLGRLNTVTEQSDRKFRALAGTTTEIQSRIDGLVGVTDKLAKSAKDSALSFAEFDEAKSRVDRLRASFDPLFSASKRYEAAMEDLDAAQARGVITQREYADLAQRSAKAYLGAANDVSGSSSRLASQVQNASYQVGDFFVQIAGGTSATRAFAQQFPQLIGGFGAWGAAVGAAVAIGAAVVPMLMGQEKEAKKLSEQIDDLAARTSDYKDAVDKALQSLPDLWTQFGAGAARAKEVYAALLQIEKLEYLKSMQDTTTSISTTLSGLKSQLDAINRTTLLPDEIATERAVALKEQIATLGKEFGVTTVEAQGVVDAMNALDAAKDKGPAAVAAAAKVLADRLMEAQDAGADIPTTIMDASKALYRLSIDAGEIAPLMGDSAAAAEDARSRTDAWASAMSDVRSEVLGIGSALSSIGGGMISNAAKYVELNARRAGASAAEAVRARKEWEIDAAANAASIGGSWYDKFLAGVRAEVEKKGLDIDAELATLNASDRKDKKGGGETKDPLMQKLASVRNALASQAELELAAYAAQQQTLEEALEKRKLTQIEYNDLTEKAQQQHAEKMAQIDAYRYGDGLQKTGAFFGDMASAMASGNEKMQRIAQKFAAVEALINAWRAYNQTLADPSLPFFAKFAAAASVLASGLNAVQTIKGSSGSGGSGGSSASSSAASTAATVSPTQIANYRITGDVIGRQTGAELVSSINAAIKDGYQINLEWA